MAAPAVPTLAEISAIVAIGDPVARNFRITQCYFELSNALAHRLSGAGNWCTFATWASKQAGQSIRREDFDAAIRSLLEDLSRGSAATAVITALQAAGSRAGAAEITLALRWALGIDAAMERTSDAIARGNTKVFEEIAPIFAAYCAERLRDETWDRDAIEAFVARLAPGDPPNGQLHLRNAFESYHVALFTPDELLRAQAIFFATVSIGLHEQTRLQPEIEEALGAAVEDPRVVVARLETALLPRQGWFAQVRQFTRRLFGRRSPLDRAVAELVETVRAKLRPIITEHMLSLEMPGARIRLGDDLSHSFPARLATLTEPRLIALVASVDPTPDSVQATGATDWADFHERMHFIADLFRVMQENPALLGPPFPPAQAAAIKAGRAP